MQQYKIKFSSQIAKDLIAKEGRDQYPQDKSIKFKHRRQNSVFQQKKYFQKVHTRNKSLPSIKPENIDLNDILDQVIVQQIKVDQANNIDLTDWEPVLLNQRYSVNKILGSGSFGMVSKGYCNLRKCEIAIKKITNYSQSDYDCLRVLREIQIMKTLSKHPTGSKYVPEIYEIIICKKTNSVFIIMEYFWTDLRRLIDKHINNMSKKHITQLIYSLIQGLQFIHSCNIIHRDVKPDNIYITKNLQVKIGDFGLSRNLPPKLTGKGSCNSLRVRNFVRKQDELEKKLDNEYTKTHFAIKIQNIVDQLVTRDRLLTGYFGTRWYRAPEVLLVQRQYDYAQDMWSIGCIIFEILHSAYPPQKDPKGTILFRGDFCSFLSEAQEENGYQLEKQKDQISTVINQLPQLEQHDLSFIIGKNETILNKMLQLIQDTSIGNHFLTRLGQIPEDFKKLLLNLLQFNPYIRWSAKECLDLEIFQRLLQGEKQIGNIGIKIFLDIDDIEDETKYTNDDLLEMIAQEQEFVQPVKKIIVKNKSQIISLGRNSPSTLCSSGSGLRENEIQ